MARILIIAGEPSGDLHGASLAGALRALRPDAELFGVGGPKMAAAGVRLVQGIDGLAAIGMIGLAQVAAAARIYVRVRAFLRESPLDVVVLIDSPALNLGWLAPLVKRAGHRVVYYIAPQIWAWRPGRIRKIARLVNRVIVVLPFEPELYRRAGVPCDFVGHPLLDAVAPAYDRAELRKRFGLDGEGQVLGLLPGSREREVRTLLPLMLEATRRLAAGHPGLRAVIAQAPSIPDALIRELVAGAVPAPLVVKDLASEAMAAADVLLVASGTATLQAAVVGTPMVLAYRVSWLTYWVGRALVTVDCIGLVNLVAGRKIVPELIQHEARADRLAAEAGRLLDDHRAHETMRAELRAVRDALGSPGASRRAADAVLKECRA